MTLAGTRTWIVGERRVALIDPGPAIESHVDAVADAIAGFDTVAVLLTHDHPDHAEAAGTMAARFGASVRAAGAGTLTDADRIDTDAGELVAIATPGHAPDHIAFHWPAARRVFCGDLMMGGLDSALVAPPEGDLTDYLASLRRLRALEPEWLHPAHGPSFDAPPAAIDRYIRHREERLDAVLGALHAAPGPVGERTLVEAVYGGEIPPGLEEVATGALLAYLGYLEGDGRARRDGTGWSAVSDRTSSHR